MLADDELFSLIFKSTDGHYTPHIWIDITGDLATGTLLSKILYWFSPDKEGKTRLRIERGGELWLAKHRNDWWAECRISRKQFDRSITILRDLGFVETRVFRFGGFPTLHIRLIIPAVIQGVKTLFPKGEELNVPLGNNDIPLSVTSLHTITTDNNYSTLTTEEEEEEESEMSSGGKSDEAFKQVQEAYENAISEMTPIIADKVKIALEKHSVTTIIRAIEHTRAKAGTPNWRYVEKVLIQGVLPDRRGAAPERDPDRFTKGKYGHIVNR